MDAPSCHQTAEKQVLKVKNNKDYIKPEDTPQQSVHKEVVTSPYIKSGLFKQALSKENENKYTITPLANPPKAVQNETIAATSTKSWISKFFRQNKNSIRKPVQEKVLNSSGDGPGSHCKAPVADMNLKKACKLVSKKLMNSSLSSPSTHYLATAAGNSRLLKKNKDAVCQSVQEDLLQSSGDGPGPHCKFVKGNSCKFCKPVQVRRMSCSGDSAAFSWQSTAAEKLFQKNSNQACKPVRKKILSSREDIPDCNVSVAEMISIYRHREVINGLDRFNRPSTSSDRRFLTAEEQVVEKKNLATCNITVIYPSELKYLRGRNKLLPGVSRLRRAVERSSLFPRRPKNTQSFDTRDDRAARGFLQELLNSRLGRGTTPEFDKSHELLFMSKEDMPHEAILTEPLYLNHKASYSSPIFQLFRTDESRSNSPVLDSTLDIGHGEGDACPTPQETA
ncbi:uncharacterized protein [Ambystoma mexicanum]|uniref:uncharacterized protein isoform X1 n=1 Tax=Ambystoma mexicanum TaxID=8296 RepID=UPI0037E7F8C1